MRKLKLESLNVESFDTTAASCSARGTVQGNDLTGHGGPSVCLCPATEDWACQTDSPEACGDTHYLDCTLACTDFASCQGGC